MRELIIDSFAGGGGASEGIKRATGRNPDYAINHDGAALAMHEANHPGTIHLSKNIYHVDPMDVVQNRRVGLLWASPDCKHFSRAKGSKPVKREIRDLAWVVVSWARRARPRVIILENVQEFQDWGPVLYDDGVYKPCPERRGATFKRFVASLRRLGYSVQWRRLKACDYGAPTIRERLFMIARCDQRAIVWPEATHGAPDSEGVLSGKLKPWRTAAEIIDWSLPCHSIFMGKEEARKLGLKRPLVEATLARIAKGIQRFVFEAKEPFIVPDSGLAAHIEYAQQGGGARNIAAPMHTVTASRKDANLLVSASISKFRKNSVGIGMLTPMPTVTANSFEKRPAGAPPLALVSAFLAQHNLGVVGRRAEAPVSTVTQAGSQQAIVSAGLINMKGSKRSTRSHEEPLSTITSATVHAAEVRAFLVKYYGTGGGQDFKEPLHTVTSRDRMGIVTIRGEAYQIVDIGMRMLTPRELFRAQGFPDDYDIEPEFNGAPLTRSAQIRMCGNSVCPDVAAALVSANYCASHARPIPSAEIGPDDLFGAVA